MSSKRRRVSDLTADDSDLVIRTLNQFMSSLDADDDETIDLIHELERTCTKLRGKTVFRTIITTLTNTDLTIAYPVFQ